MHKLGRVAWAAFIWPLFSWAQTASPPGVPARMVVTLGHYYGKDLPVLTRDDLTVTERYAPLPVTNLVPLRGDRAGLELFVLVDNCSNCEPGSNFQELRRFIGAQPSTTSVGVAYIQNGHLDVIEKPTQDHERAVKALNTPAGSKPANPFVALAELINGWPQGSPRHVVLMISNGIDPSVKDTLLDPSAEAAIEAAQRAGVIVYAIYHPSADYLTSDFSKVYAGQVQLAHLAYETGGEAYCLGLGPLPSLGPFLADIGEHLANRYLLEFTANPVEPAGALEDVTVKSKNSEIELMAPARVWVSGGRATGQKHRESTE